MTAVSYLERYQNGEHEQVWQELVAAGAAIRSEPLYSEARAVAQEMMRRARHNVELIVTRLRLLGYQFEAEQPRRNPFDFDIGQTMQNIAAQARAREGESDLPEGIANIFEQMQETMTRHLAAMSEELQQLSGQWQSEQSTQSAQSADEAGTPACSAWMPPDETFLAELAAFDRDYGPLPLVLRAWYEEVGQVNLMGDHPKLNCYYHEGPASDPLVVFYAGDEVIDQIEEDEEEGRRGRRLYSFDIAPDACHKSNTSGGSPTFFKVPNAGFDGPLVCDDEWDSMFFLPYLRICFAWGGFPGLKSNPAAAEAAREELALLTKDLLPL